MSYRAFLLISSGLGALPSLTFVLLYMVADRPKYRDRYAWLVLGLGVLAFSGFFIPFLLTLTNPVAPVAPTQQWRWGVSIILRGASAAFMWWLLWIYLTPGRAKHRLGRFGQIRQGGGSE